jgi:hypothetical protein
LAKKILIVGKANNTLIDSLINKLKEDFGNNLIFDLFSLTPIDGLSNDSFNKIIDGSIKGMSKGIFKIPKIGAFFYRNRIKNKFKIVSKNYDYIHFHFIFSILNEFEESLIQFKGKIIASVWGSDFYRRDNSARLDMYKFYNQVDLITFANPTMRQDFFNFYNKLKMNFLDVRFGLSLLNDLNTLSPSSQYKSEFNIPKDKLSIYVGTNGSRGQQHLKIIGKLKDLSTNIKRRIFIVLPLNYGLDKEYEKEIISAMDNFDIPYIIIKDYFEEKKLISFRKACDILLQLQTTDALSGAMQEHLFFGSLVITGNWLPYEIFDNKGIYYHKINKMDQLVSKIETLVNNFEKEKENCMVNRVYTKEISSWETNINKWHSCYSI